MMKTGRAETGKLPDLNPFPVLVAAYDLHAHGETVYLPVKKLRQQHTFIDMKQVKQYWCHCSPLLYSMTALD